jgi:hypothetical protein
MLPDLLRFEITGFSREHHGIEWRDGWLWHRQAATPLDRPIETKVAPEPRQWESFWKSVEAADVWHWRKEYSSEVCDGTQWSLKLQRGEQRVRCEGSNAYPGSDDPDCARSVQFGRWLRALRALTGHPIR